MASLAEIEKQKIPIQKAYLLSCVNSRVEDLAAAATVLQGKKVAPGVKLYLGAASKWVQEEAERRGIWQTLLDAGLQVADLRGAGFPFFNLYRLAVVARGEKLIDDAAGDDGSRLPLAARATIKMFSWLFRANRHTGVRGWQLVAVAVEPFGGRRVDSAAGGGRVHEEDRP